MSDVVTLELRASLTEQIDADCIVPDAFAGLGEREIAALPVWIGKRRAPLGDYFTVTGAQSSKVKIVGNVELARGVGAGMAAGSMEIQGDAGDDVGVGMSGGSIHVRGNAGDRIGAALPGASRGMTGGEIIVEGSVGTNAGARMRRGLLYVGGDADDRVARAIIAGTVIVTGRVGIEPAFASKRGTLVVAGGIQVPATYRYACDYEPPYVRLALTYLARRYGLSISRSLIAGPYRRYCGDASTVGKGEILEWVW
jgi:formylmethanofuran dehydrogenase subunit C